MVFFVNLCFTQGPFCVWMGIIWSGFISKNSYRYRLKRVKYGFIFRRYFFAESRFRCNLQFSSPWRTRSNQFVREILFYILSILKYLLRFIHLNFNLRTIWFFSCKSQIVLDSNAHKNIWKSLLPFHNFNDDFFFDLSDSMRMLLNANLCEKMFSKKIPNQ